MPARKASIAARRISTPKPQSAAKEPIVAQRLKNASDRNVPFLLNAFPKKPDLLSDLVLMRIAHWFRRKRFKDFDAFLTGVETILDLGGTPEIWLRLGRRSGILLLNIDEQAVPAGFETVTGNACETGFEDQSFDLAFSNSTIEHVGTFDDQETFAREICRVGKRVYCQTPARRFFFEPHYFTPFVHWFPFLLKRYWFVRYFTHYGLKWKPSKEQVEDFQKHLRLLSYAEMKRLFPGCRIRKEHFLGMTKSYIAVR